MSNTQLLLLLGAAGFAAWYFYGDNKTTNPVGPGVYVPPPQAVPQYGGRPSPSAPGPAGWGLVPPQPSGAQDAAAIIGAIGQLGQGFASAWNAVSDDYS